MRKMRCLECDWTNSKEKLIKNGRCPSPGMGASNDKIIFFQYFSETDICPDGNYTASFTMTAV